MADKLAHVKAFWLSMALDGFGQRRHLDMERLDPARKYIQMVAVPKLLLAIQTDDPAYHPVDNPNTSAESTTAVREYVELTEIHRDFMRLYDPYGELFHLMFTPGQVGCFLGDLTAALKADDPDWRPDE